MPTWSMLNSTLTGNARVWFDKLPKESIDSYEDLRTAFRENYLQQTKHIKDPVEIHHIKQRDGESTEDFMERYKAEVLDVEGAPECMRISGFMHGITHPGLIKRLYERIPRSVDEMYRMTTSFLQGEVAALSHGRRKASSPWKPSEGGDKPTFKKGFKNKQRPDRKPDRFSLLTKTPKEIFALEKGKFKAPPPMVTPVEKRDPSKYCEFHSDTGHNTNECMQLRKQIDEMIKAGKLVAKPRITQSFSPETAMSFPPLSEEDGTESPMIIEVEMGGHFVHRVYVDGGASSERRDNLAAGPDNASKNRCEYTPPPLWLNFMVISWLSNPVMVKKHDGTWRMCVDFKDLNNACPKDCYLLPEIDWKVESLCGYSFQIVSWDALQGVSQRRNVLGLQSKHQRLKACPDKADAVLSLPSSEMHQGHLEEAEVEFELEGYDIQYRPRTAIKGQILADFIVERPEEESPDELMAEPEVLPEPWTLFTDGSSCVDGSGAGHNNEGRIEALIAGSDREQMGVKNLQANVDSRLVANQVNGFYTAKESGMVQYLNKVKTLAKSFKEFSIKQIPRSENKKADALSKIASTSFAHLNKQVLVEELKEKSINEKEILDVVEEEGNTWMTPICEYLTKEILSEDTEARAVPPRNAVVCHDQWNPVQEILFRSMAPWGIDIAGPFPEGPGKVKFLIVAIDYFHKWIEASRRNHHWQSSEEVRMDTLSADLAYQRNPYQTMERQFWEIHLKIGEGIKARLEERSKDWIEELPHVLWAHRTMIKSSNGETPFSLTYGTEAVIPAEIGMPTLRTAEVDQANNNEALGISLDLIEERREQAAIQEAKSKKKMEKYYNSRVRGTSFKPGEMVYRSNEASHAKDGGKLGPK
ncbi:reverse transcriptase domain-containing protein [Tanacetum coccineum]|uniref:Reverse transcriptase domain-containing protein n=1 Tax=Tanacetum coccineum TaxID=301880 RepID=A0ABQ5AIZ0_9ASTR